MNIINKPSNITPSLNLNEGDKKQSSLERLPQKFLLRTFAQSGNDNIARVNKNCKRLFREIFKDQTLGISFLAELPVSTLLKSRGRFMEAVFKVHTGNDPSQHFHPFIEFCLENYYMD